MAYPRQIPPDPLVSADNAFLTAIPRCRPIYRGSGKVYTILNRGSGASHFASAWKSTVDGDESPWVEEDKANAPSKSRMDWQHCTVFDDGARLYCTFCPNTSFPPTAAVVQAFNTVTDLWESPTSLTNAPFPEENTGSGVMNPRAMWGSVVRANGDIVTVFSVMVDVGGTDYSGLQMRIYSSGAWGSAMDVMTPNTTDPGQPGNYELLGLVLGGDGSRIHGWGLDANQGYFHFVIRSDNTVVFHQSRSISIEFALGSIGGYFGEPTLLTLGPTTYAALPVGEFVIADGGDTFWKPCALLVEDADEVGPFRVETVEETINATTNWISICVYGEDGKLFLAWTDIEAGTLTTVIRAACTKGFAWAGPGASYTITAGQLVESMEISVSGGVLRMVLENSAGDAPFSRPHYAQVDISCTAPSCPAAGSSRNRSFR